MLQTCASLFVPFIIRDFQSPLMVRRDFHVTDDNKQIFTEHKILQPRTIYYREQKECDIWKSKCKGYVLLPEFHLNSNLASILGDALPKCLGMNLV